MVAASKFEQDYFNHNFRYVEPLSGDYEVFVNGENVPVYTCRISKIPFNRAWPGHQREINQTEIVSFVNIVSDEKTDVRVVIKREYENVCLRPYSKGIECAKNEDGVSFSLDREGQFVLSCDDLHGCLYIFNTKPVLCDDPESVTYYFGPGIHMAGKIVLKSNESIYVDKDALVFGCVYAEDAKNIRVFGNGLFDDSGEERFFVHCYESFTNGNAKFYHCENVRIEGVLFKNSPIWCVSVFQCEDVVMDSIKVFGQWRYNTDGVDIVNSKNITLKNSFVHSFDDSVTIKGVDRHIETSNENILTDNCVLWCDWGKVCEIGHETACREYKNITFKNCDIIRAGNTALDIQNGDCAEVYDVTYENINVEFNSFDNFPVLQEDDDCIYDDYDKEFVPRLISIDNHRFRCDYYCNDIWCIPREHAPLNLDGIEQACVHDVRIKNINVYYDEKIKPVEGKKNIELFIGSCLDDVEFRDIYISEIRINGVLAGENDVILKTQKVRNFNFK